VPGKSLHIEVEIAVACELADVVDEVVIGGKMVALEQRSQSHERTRMKMQRMPENNLGEVFRLDLVLTAIQL